MSAAGVTVSTAPVHGAGAGSTPSAALHSLLVKPIPLVVAKTLLVRRHYLHSLPGGTCIAFGIFLESRLVGALTFGAGPSLAYSLVKGAKRDNCLVLTRFWTSGAVPQNGESRVIGIVLRALRRHTVVKFLVTYADPAAGHLGTIYQASGWGYVGLSCPMPLYDIGDGVPRHSRSLARSYGSHSIRHFENHGSKVRLIPQMAKHRYVYFLDPLWRCRLNAPVLPYPKREQSNETD